MQTCRRIALPRFVDARGELIALEHGSGLPFPIKRVFYMRKVPAEASRAQHALKTCEQFIIAVQGSFQTTVTDGRQSRTFLLDDPNSGVYVPAMVWRTVDAFTPDAICLVLASTEFSEDDYVRDYSAYIALSGGRQ
ncbi:MAG: FdtA/QdtA family cupin domain-containing protein [Thermoflexales bacterium]